MSMHACTIRRIELSESTLWKALRLMSLQESPLSFGSSYETEKEWTEQQWKEGLERVHIFGAFVEEQLIGAAGVTCSQIVLGVKSINERAIAFYKKLGFEVYAVEPKAIKVGDVFYDDTLMVKFLE